MEEATPTAMRRKPTFIMLAAGSVAVVVGVLAREPIVAFLRPAPEGAEQQAPSRPKVRLPPTPEEVAKPHLAWAAEECDRVVEEHLKALDAFFADSQRNTPAFAAQALSWGSKWRLIADYVPYTKGGRHETFIRQKFEQHVFKPAELEEAVSQVVAGYLQHVNSIEGRMLVRIRADVAEFPSAYLISRVNPTGLQAAYDEALARAMRAASANLRADVATELVSIITGEVLAQVAVRLGVSAGILGSGAASTWATFGIGLVVGVIVDQIVSWVWDWYADPKGNLARQLDQKLDEINRMIVDGTEGVTGLRTRLHEFAGQRAALRRQAVLALLESH